MFKNNFVKLCNKKGVAPTVVCQAIGLTASAFTNWSETSVPRRATLQKFADYFGVTVEYLLRNESPATGAEIAIRMAHDPTFAASVQNRGVRVPVYGNVAAGIPIEAITEIEDYEEISQEMAAKGEYAALRIHGDSMEPRMAEGDVVIVRIQETIESGETAIVMVNGCDATCKKVMRTPDGITLIATNPKYAPMFYSNKQIEELPVRIWGKVVELRAKF